MPDPKPDLNPDPRPPIIDARLARRSFLLAAGAFIAGCTTAPSGSNELPRAEFPGGTYDDLPSPRVITPPAPPRAVAPTPSPQPWTGGVVPRTMWAKSGPDLSDVRPMLPVKYITVHHEGWEPFTATGFDETAARIERVRVGHRNAKDGGYADIGYHFVIDREGRVWEARSLRYQGAHVKYHNEGNIGIMCLGNFEVQSPTKKQLAALTGQVKAMQDRYNVPVSRVKTHQEWKDAQTLCPGRSMQNWVDKNRRSAFA